MSVGPGGVVAPWSAEEAGAKLRDGARTILLPSGRALETLVADPTTGSWEVWYGGAGASYARRPDGVVARSLRRLGECLGVTGPASHEEAAAVWVGYLAAFKLEPSAGIAGLVQRLAPQLRHWRIDTSSGELWRERLCLAGRAEVLRWRVPSPVVVYDMASAYPWSYSISLPGDLRSGSRTEVPGHDCCAGEVTVHVPEDMEIPPLPCAGGAGWAWPVGSWRGWLAGPELHLADRLGLIRKAHRIWVWDQASPLAAYAQELYAIRRSAPDPQIASVVKLLLNSTFGLLASQIRGRLLHVRPATIPPGGKPISPGVWETAPKTRPGIYHPLAAAILTSRVRERLYLAASQCEGATYVGVDAIHAPLGARGAPPVGGGDLGSWRADGTWMDGATYLAPGRYILQGDGPRVRHCGAPSPGVIRDLAVHGKASFAVDGDPLTGRVGYTQTLSWTPEDGRWIGTRHYQGEATRPPTVEAWKAAAGEAREPPSLADLGGE